MFKIKVTFMSGKLETERNAWLNIQTWTDNTYVERLDKPQRANAQEKKSSELHDNRGGVVVQLIRSQL